MERENIDFYKIIREGYLLLAETMPDRVLVVDGTKDEAAIARKIWSAVTKILKAA